MVLHAHTSALATDHCRFALGLSVSAADLSRCPVALPLSTMLVGRMPALMSAGVSHSFTIPSNICSASSASCSEPCLPGCQSINVRNALPCKLLPNLQSNKRHQHVKPLRGSGDKTCMTHLCQTLLALRSVWRLIQAEWMHACIKRTGPCRPESQPMHMVMSTVVS